MLFLCFAWRGVVYENAFLLTFLINIQKHTIVLHMKHVCHKLHCIYNQTQRNLKIRVEKNLANALKYAKFWWIKQCTLPQVTKVFFFFRRSWKRICHTKMMPNAILLFDWKILWTVGEHLLPVWCVGYQVRLEPVK